MSKEEESQGGVEPPKASQFREVECPPKRVQRHPEIRAILDARFARKHPELGPKLVKDPCPLDEPAVPSTTPQSASSAVCPSPRGLGGRGLQAIPGFYRDERGMLRRQEPGEEKAALTLSSGAPDTPAGQTPTIGTVVPDCGQVGIPGGKAGRLCFQVMGVKVYLEDGGEVLDFKPTQAAGEKGET